MNMNMTKYLLAATAFLGFMLPCGATDYNVNDFGAAGNGITDDAAAIQRAIDTCSAKGGGTVVFESGRKYLFQGRFISNPMWNLIFSQIPCFLRIPMNPSIQRALSARTGAKE